MNEKIWKYLMNAPVSQENRALRSCFFKLKYCFLTLSHINVICVI